MMPVARLPGPFFSISASALSPFASARATASASRRNTSAKSFTSSASTSASTISSPSPSTFIWSRPTNHFSRSRKRAEHIGFAQKSFGPSRSTSPLHTGHAVGASIGVSWPVRFSTTARTTCGMISPAFSTMTWSPILRSRRWISSMLWSVACFTVEPATNTAFIVARGVMVPPLPTCHSTFSSTVSFCSAGYLNATAQRGLLEVKPSFSCSSKRSMRTTMPSTAKSSFSRLPAKSSIARAAASTDSSLPPIVDTGTPSSLRYATNSECAASAGRPSPSPRPCATNESRREATIFGSLFLSVPTHELRAFAKSCSPCFSRSALMRSNSRTGMKISPRTSRTGGMPPHFAVFGARSASGIARIARTLPVTRSPFSPSPRVTASTSAPSS